MADPVPGQQLYRAPQSPGESPYLIGGRCRTCGYIFFPFRRACIRCRQEGCTEETKLGPRGALQTFAIMQVGRPGFPAPYAMGYVRTEQGAIVFAPLSDSVPLDDTSLAIGQQMELVIEETGASTGAAPWRFRPVRK